MKLSVLALSVLALTFCGCDTMHMAMKKIANPDYKEEKVLPKILVFPFEIENAGLTEKITKGFVGELNKDLEILDSQKFQASLTTHPVRMSPYFPPPVSTATPNVESPVFVPKIPISTISILSPPMQQLAVDLFKKEDVRAKFYQESKIDYFVTGRGKEQERGDLEAAIVNTAETVQMKLLDLKSGELLLEENFKQGSFEIVAPDRIGSKLASKVNQRLRELWKEEKLRKGKKNQERD